MKIKISYESDQEADELIRIISSCFPVIRVHKALNHQPYKHIYITVNKALTQQNNSGIIK